MQRAVLVVVCVFGFAACETQSSGGEWVGQFPADPPQYPAGNLAPPIAADSGSGAPPEVAAPAMAPPRDVCPAIGPPSNCQMSTESECPKNVTCYPYNTCGGGMLWCCDARPTCSEGDLQLAQASCPSDVSCYQVALCGTQIACLDKAAIKGVEPEDDAGAS